MLIAGLSFLASAQGPSIAVVSREGRKPLPVTTINNQDYIAVDDVNTAFATTSREDRLAGGLTITARGRSIVLTENQNVVSVAGRLVTLPSPPVRRDGRWFVPADFLPRALAAALDTRLDLRRSARLLIVGDLRVPRVVARIDAGANNVAVTFDITPNTETRVNAQQGRLIVQFDADVLDLSIPLVPPQGFLQNVTPGDTPTTIALILGPRYALHRVTTSQPDAGSGRLTIDLMPATTDVAPAPAPPAAAPDTRLVIPTRGPSTGLRTVVLDPGHGGDELGTQGAKGTLEKEITLSVARRLRTLIESRLGLKVFLTREDDRTMSLDERSAFANNHRADVFLSIHANSAVRPSIKGAEVYYLTVERGGCRGPEESRRERHDPAGARRRQSRHRLDSVGDGAGALPRAVGHARRIHRTGDEAAGRNEPARGATGAVPRPGRRQYAGGARRNRLSVQRRPGRPDRHGVVPGSGRAGPARRAHQVPRVP